MAPIVDVEILKARLGVADGSQEETDLELLLDAVSDQLRGLSRRNLEGTPTLYRETYEPQGSLLILDQVPVTDVLWVRPLEWDHTPSDIYDPFEVDGGASTTLAAAAAAGDVTIKVDDVSGLVIGQHLRLGTDSTREVVRVTSVGTAGAGGSGVGVEPALAEARALGHTVREVAGSTAWRLMSATRGRLHLRYRRELVEVGYRVSGEISSAVEQAAIDWIETRWKTTPAMLAGLTSYRTGHDAESYDTERLAGTPPASVYIALGITRHLKGAVI